MIKVLLKLYIFKRRYAIIIISTFTNTEFSRRKSVYGSKKYDKMVAEPSVTEEIEREYGV